LIPLKYFHKNISSISNIRLTQFKLYSISIFILFSLFACTTNRDVSTSNIIQKRKYRKGYYVNFSHKNKKKSIINYNNNSEDCSSSISSTDSINKHVAENKNIILASANIETDIPTILKNEEDQHVSKTIINKKHTHKIISSIKQGISTTACCPKKNIFKKNDNLKTEYLSAIAFLLGTLALASDISSYLHLAVYLNFTFATFLPMLVGIAAIILSKKSLKKFKNNPNVYKGKGLAIFGLILGYITFFIGFILLLATLFASTTLA